MYIPSSITAEIYFAVGKRLTVLKLDTAFGKKTGFVQYMVRTLFECHTYNFALTIDLEQPKLKQDFKFRYVIIAARYGVLSHLKS